jgi:hypothetical protein
VINLFEQYQSWVRLSPNGKCDLERQQIRRNRTPQSLFDSRRLQRDSGVSSQCFRWQGKKMAEAEASAERSIAGSGF